MGLLDRIAVATLPLVPGGVMRRLAMRYIAGEELEDALQRLEELGRRGYGGIIDLLGEDVSEEAVAREVMASYRAGADAIQGRGIDAYVSIKPTHLGLLVSEELCHELFATLASHLADRGAFLRVEMEDHTTTGATLRIFERLRARYDNVGLVLQSRLLRTPGDIEALAPGPLDVRMVKGIYLEPEEIAHVDPEPIRAAFVECSRALFQRGAFVAFATHDDLLGRRLAALCSELGRGSGDYEFQVLLGVQQALWRRWKEEGHRVRVYVPYGPQWRAYCQRRLSKNPRIFRHVVADVVGLGT